MTVPGPAGTGSGPKPTGPAATGRPAGRWRTSRARAALPLARHVTVMMPWGTLVGGCAAGAAVLALMAQTSRTPLNQTTLRLTFIPAVAALVFIPHAYLRPLSQTTPLPAWITPAIQILLAVPVVVLSCWGQLLIMTHTYPPIDRPHLPAVYPLIAQLIGWSTLAVAIATCCYRSRYRDLAGAIAAPAAIAAIALAWGAPGIKDSFVIPPATPRAATIAWYSIAAGSTTVTIAALRDTWHRYTRTHRRAI